MSALYVSLTLSNIIYFIQKKMDCLNRLVKLVQQVEKTYVGHYFGIYLFLFSLLATDIQTPREVLVGF